jgi:5-methyltetrahydrofolate--homocysteine methyltransferase
LSGLITPSLDEMIHVAKEMQRADFSVPLLIGGATTSKAHTALKIQPHYHHGVIHVIDASRSVNVVSSLLNPERKNGYLAEINAEYETLRAQYADRSSEKSCRSGSQANAFVSDWQTVDIQFRTGSA